MKPKNCAGAVNFGGIAAVKVDDTPGFYGGTYCWTGVRKEVSCGIDEQVRHRNDEGLVGGERPEESCVGWLMFVWVASNHFLFVNLLCMDLLELS